MGRGFIYGKELDHDIDRMLAYALDDDPYYLLVQVVGLPLMMFPEPGPIICEIFDDDEEIP